jgi:hypothetical protein
MSTRHHGRHVLHPGALAVCVALVGATALSTQAVPAGASRVPWRALFPPAAAYPRGTHLLPLQASTRPAALVDAATAAQVARLGFVAGGIQDANLPGHVVASVTVLTFRTARGAATFLRQDRPSALAKPNTRGTAVGGLGDGARYVAGACASCGPGAAPLGILILRQGTAVVQILTQPTDHDLALRLGQASVRH